METGFLNFHDEEHFSTMPSSSLYDQSDMLEDSESSLLDMIPDGYAHYEAWDAEQELNGDFATMPGPIATGARPHTKEDFHKMLNEWQEHLGSMQASDSEEIYDGIERMTTDLPGLDIYDESSFDGDNINKKLDKTQTKKSKASGKKVVGKDLPLGHFVRDETDADELMGLGAAKVSAAAAAAQAGNMAEDSVDDDAFRIDVEDDCIDVETVAANEQIPVLEAVDVSSLLEQFEATESVNSTASTIGHQAQLDNHLFAMATQKLNGKCPTSARPTAAMSHQNIIDALPKEVIERIKASGRKKAIPVIPAMPSKRPGRGGTRMQDAGAALSRNKLLKLVSSAPLTGESIQLDHDYCTATSTASSSPEVIPPTRSFYHSDASEYVRSDDRPKPPPAEKVYSRLPDYYMVLGSLGAVPKKESDSSRKDCDSRKDSGLESGDLSDATSEESTHSTKPFRSETARPVSSDVANLNNINIPSVVQPKNSTMTSTTTSDKIVTINGKAISFGTLMKKVNKTLECGPVGTSVPKVEPAESAATQKNSDKPMVSVLKRNSAADEVLVRDTLQEDVAVSVKVEPKKRKLNLLEYRSRVRVLDRVRGSCESSRASSPVTPDPQAVEEAIQEFYQHTEIMINKDGRIDEESLATLSKTLEKKAAIKQPPPPPAAAQHETFWPRLIACASESETKVRAEEKLCRDARAGGGVRIKEEKVVVKELCADRAGLHDGASENLAQLRVREGRLKWEVECVVKADVEKPSGGVVKFERTCGKDSDELAVSPRPAWNEVDVVEMTVGDGFVKVEPDGDSEAVGQTEPDADWEAVGQIEPDGDSEAVGHAEPDVVDALCDEECSVEEPLETSDDSLELVISDAHSMNDDNILVVEVGADVVQPMMVDVCSSERVEVEEISIAVEEVSGREHSKGREHNRDQDNSHAGVTRDRSRRQYRSRRTASSSSSSSSNSHTSRRKPTEPAQRNRRSDQRTRHKSRSRSPSTSSNYSSQSRSSSQSKSRSWRTSRYDCNRNRRSGSSHSQTSQQSRCSYRSRMSCRSRSPVKRGVEYQLTEREKERQVEERRVIYVGRIDEGMTKAEMRTLFETFGPIVDISVHFREHGDNYGFVTFAYKVDAYAAVEQGKKDPTLGQFDLSFGGRRAFCKTRYADLDGSRMDPDEYSYAPQRPRPRPPTSGVNFDDLLREALRSKKEVGKTKV